MCTRVVCIAAAGVKSCLKRRCYAPVIAETLYLRKNRAGNAHMHYSTSDVYKPDVSAISANACTRAVFEFMTNCEWDAVYG